MISKLTYKKAGVDIDAGNELVRRIRKMNPSIGGFSGHVPIGNNKLLVAGTDGVGTKLKLALEMHKHDTIGIDLVAMSVNDIVTSGAKPLFFLDYFATGKLDVDQAETVIRGIYAGCVESGCVLLGGETAEMPGFYGNGEYDLAGFAVGMVDDVKLIDGSTIKKEDVVIAFPSSGVHSNGFSLVRKVLEVSKVSLDSPCSWETSQSIGEILLRPTHMYVKTVLDLHDTVGLKGVVHITGGGLAENIPRVLPKGLGVHIHTYQVPELFKWLQVMGNVPIDDMRRTFNMGIGLTIVVSPDKVVKVLEAYPSAFVLGTVVPGDNVTFA